MDPNRPKSARHEDLDAAKTNQPPETAAAHDRQRIVDSASDPDDALPDDMQESVADNLPLPANNVADGHAHSDTDAPPTDAAIPSEAAAYARPPLHPMMWKIDRIAAANTSATIQSEARRPEVQELVAGTPELSTLPLLDADGQRPQDTQQMFRSLFLWEAAAAEAVGDPLFTPKPTSKPRNQLTKISRGPRFPDVWVDQHTLQPVLFDGEDEYAMAAARPWQRPAMPVRSTPQPQARGVVADATPHIDQPLSAVPARHSEAAPVAESYSPSAAPSDEAGMPGFSWPRVIVELSEPEKFFEAELDAIADRQRAIARYEADEAVYEYDSWNQAEERALWGKH